MDNAQKAIMIGVALFLTILIIAVVLLVTNTGLNSTRTTGGQIATISKSLEKQLISQYNQKTLTGQDVADAIDNYNLQINNNIIVMVGNPYSKVNFRSAVFGYKVKLNASDYLVINTTDSVTTIEALNSFVGSKDGSNLPDGFWNTWYWFYTSPYFVATNAFLKEKIDLNSTYKGYLIRNHLSEIIGLVFMQV